MTATITFTCANCFEDVERPARNGPCVTCSRECAHEYRKRHQWARGKASPVTDRDRTEGVESCRRIANTAAQGVLTEQTTEPRWGRADTSPVASAAGERVGGAE